jgi:uncharacterized integral membrane protein
MNSLSAHAKGSAGIRTVITIILLIIFTIFILQNTSVVEIKFLFWELSMSRVLILLGALLIGVLVGLLIGRGKSEGKDKQI